jgi:hypothetical protein
VAISDTPYQEKDSVSEPLFAHPSRPDRVQEHPSELAAVLGEQSLAFFQMPHVAEARPQYLELALELFIDSLTRYVTGNALLSRVDPIVGYPLRD